MCKVTWVHPSMDLCCCSVCESAWRPEFCCVDVQVQYCAVAIVLVQFWGPESVELSNKNFDVSYQSGDLMFYARMCARVRVETWQMKERHHRFSLKVYKVATSVN